MRTGRPERLTGFDYRGLHRYFLTFCTYQRRPVFLSADRVETVLRQILRAAHDQHFAVLAYCVMPDHVHLLIEGQADCSDCRRFISKAKQLSGFHYLKMFGQRLWQLYGFERTLRDDEDSLSVARYIAENPVRAGLTLSPSEYPFLGSSVYPLSEILEAVQFGDRWWE